MVGREPGANRTLNSFVPDDDDGRKSVVTKAQASGIVVYSSLAADC